RCDLALALYASGETEKALAQYREASLLQPDWPDQHNAFILSRLIRKESKPAQAEESVDAAMEICQATRFSDPRFLDTLAAAYAETGRFEEAVRAARRALDLAAAARQHTLTKQIQKHIRYYEQRRSFREADAEENQDT